MKFNEINIGDTETIKHVITHSDLGKFVEITGDDNAVHVSDEYGKPTVHGMLTASFISTIIGTKLPGNGALWYEQTMTFTAPVRIDDEIMVRAVVVEKEQRDNSIVLDINIDNQRGQTVLKGKSKIRILEKREGTTLVETSTQRTALVIGGTGGIGREVVAELTRLGFKVIATYLRRDGEAAILKEKYGCDVVKLDVQYDLFNIDTTVDVVINCSAMSITNRPIEKTERMDIEEELDFSLFFNLDCVQKLYTHMKKQHYGKVILLGSSAMNNPVEGWGSYIIGKYATYGLMRVLSNELAPHGVRVNMVSPSLVETNLVANIPPKTKLIIESKTPLRKTTTAQEVAQVIGFLVSPIGDSVTGQNIYING